MIDNVSNYTRCRVITTFMGSKTNYIHTKSYNRKKKSFRFNPFLGFGRDNT